MSELKTEFVAPIITQIINADPVVKCRDCEHWFHDESTDGYCEVTECFFWREDDFCSRAVRREFGTDK